VKEGVCAAKFEVAHLLDFVRKSQRLNDPETKDEPRPNP